MLYCAHMRIGPWWIPVFTLRVAFGCGLALLWLLGRAREPRPFTRLGGWLLGLAVTSLVMGRLGYLLEHPAYFRQNPQDALRVTQVGGIHGMMALSGGLIYSALWAWRDGRRLWPHLGRLTPAALMVIASGWWACMAVGCAWGAPARLTGGLLDVLLWQAPDLYHEVTLRYPVQALGMTWALLWLGAGIALGRDAGIALAAYAFGHGALTWLRGDPAPQFGGIHMDAWISGVWALILTLIGIHDRVTGASRRART